MKKNIIIKLTFLLMILGICCVAFDKRMPLLNSNKNLLAVVSFEYDNFDYSLSLERDTIVVWEEITFDVNPITSSVCKGQISIKIGDTSIAKLENDKIVGLKSGTTSVNVEWCGITKIQKLVVSNKKTSYVTYAIIMLIVVVIMIVITFLNIIKRKKIVKIVFAYF